MHPLHCCRSTQTECKWYFRHSQHIENLPAHSLAVDVKAVGGILVNISARAGHNPAFHNHLICYNSTGAGVLLPEMCWNHAQTWLLGVSQTNSGLVTDNALLQKHRGQASIDVANRSAMHSLMCTLSCHTELEQASTGWSQILRYSSR